MLLMKKFTKVIALILSLMLLLCFPIGVSAAEREGTGADTAAIGSLLRRLQSGNMAAYTALFGIGLLLVVYFTVFYSC